MPLALLEALLLETAVPMATLLVARSCPPIPPAFVPPVPSAPPVPVTEALEATTLVAVPPEVALGSGTGRPLPAHASANAATTGKQDHARSFTIGLQE